MELIRNEWTERDYRDFLTFLETLGDEKYRAFNWKIVPDVKNMIGVRTPILKDMAKKISKGNFQEFLQYNGNRYYEEVLVFGFVVGSIKKYDRYFLDCVKQYVYLIDNWATCDLFCSSLKLVKKHRGEFYEVIREYLMVDNPWVRRFCLVMLLDYYIDDEYLDDIFRICNEYQMEHYYVKMAIAWVVSICFIKYPKETLAYLKDNRLDKWTFNKAISKICDSYRVSKEDKEMLKKLKQ